MAAVDDGEVVVCEHMQVVGDYFVIVFTELDSQGNEVITSCEGGIRENYETRNAKTWLYLSGRKFFICYFGLISIS